MASKLEFYDGLDNYEDIVLLLDGAVIDSSTVTEVIADVNGIIINSTASPGSFAYPQAVTYKGSSVNGIRLKLAVAGTIVKFNKAIKTQLIVKTTSFPNGIVWDNNVLTTVKRAPQ